MTRLPVRFFHRIVAGAGLPESPAAPQLPPAPEGNLGGSGEPQLLDKLGKTLELIAEMRAAAPFQVELTEPVIAALSEGPGAVRVSARQTVSRVDYAGDQGGIMCGMDIDDGREHLVVVSLTQVRLPASLPFAAAAREYQKRRTKKIKKLERGESLRRLSSGFDLLHFADRRGLNATTATPSPPRA